MESHTVFDAISENSAEPAPIKKSRKLPRLIFGLLLLSLITLGSLGAIAYFTLGRLKDNFRSVTLAAAPLFTNKPVYNQIAFVGNDNNVWLVSPDGSNAHKVTEDGKGYRFPTWAPNGSYLAFIGPDDTNNTALYVTPAGQNKPTILFNEPDSAPFYLYWSPNSDSITFLTQERFNLAMRTANTVAGSSRILAMGAPFYWVWSPGGDKLLMHVGGSRAVSDEAHLSILKNQEETNRIELDLAPGRFQAPDWSADGNYIYYIASNDQGEEFIYKTHHETLEQTRITAVAGFAYMVLSPSDKHIAFLQIEAEDRLPFGTAYIIETDGQNRKRLTDSLVGSMYWSPDGTKLALLTVGLRDEGATAKIGGLAAPLPQHDSKIIFRWLVYHVESGKLERLASLTPTRDFLQTVPYFDQYHLSLTFWSPDSRYLLISKKNNDDDNGAIWVVDTTGQEEARQVGEGRLAVWSWQ